MKRLRSTLPHLTRRIAYGSLAVLLLLLMPAPYVFADGADASAASASASCTPVVATPGVKSPTGSDAATFTYDSCTGLWENQYYTWSPATKDYTPKSPYVYTCDTEHWDWAYSKWVYSPVSNKYVQVSFTTSTLPAGAIVAAGSPNPCAPAPIVTTPRSDGIGGSASNNTTNITVTNDINSLALSGSAAVGANTAVNGGATSGSSTVTANVINNVASASSLSGGNVVTFTANINGDVQGDLIIDPSQIQPASSGTSLATGADVTVNSTTKANVTNNITLNAGSGNATVTNNTAAGGATTGNAQAIANVINVLNSVISAGKSFVGVVNINGSLHGNILMPQSFLDALLATNAPRTNMTISAADASTLGITNNVSSDAATGSASVTGNTSAGSATSGAASTAVTIFNLTGSQIVGSNCLLVFVNVTGQWVGVIMNAPAGTNAAALGGGAAMSANTVANDTTNATITNNIDVNARSGNAAVTDNTKAGGATSGNASTVVNLLNLNNSQLNLSGWFGVLFINVFGSWFGNFGAYHSSVQSAVDSRIDDGSAAHTNNTSAPKPVFRFVQPTGSASVAADIADNSFANMSAHLASATGQALGAGVGSIGHNLKVAPVATSTKGSQMQIVGGILVATGLTTLVIERMVSGRQDRKIKMTPTV